ncbi:hypothetical protein [Mesorhizobium escarrei]|nr:hypothetical protein [Mesorhizobium escarrei]
MANVTGRHALGMASEIRGDRMLDGVVGCVCDRGRSDPLQQAISGIAQQS